MERSSATRPWNEDPLAEPDRKREVSATTLSPYEAQRLCDLRNVGRSWRVYVGSDVGQGIELAAAMTKKRLCQMGHAIGVAFLT